MARTHRCDMCGKQIEEVKAKLFIAPPPNHANYTAHADIGPCCLPKLNELVKFTRRVTKKVQRAA